MDPLTLAAGAAASAWVWDKYGKDLVDKLGGTAADKWSKFRSKRDWQNASDTYRNGIRRQYSTIRILGKSDPVDLEGIFSDVYILDEVTARRRFDIEALKQQHPLRHYDAESTREIREKRKDALEFIKYGQNLFILGKPGAGKTTFLKYIALSCANGRIDKIPIFISLKEWSDSSCVTIEEFIARQFEICGFPDAQAFIEYLLHTDRAIALFDGLDEVNEIEGRRAELTGLIQNFSKQYFLTQCLVTCRIAASEYVFEQFQDVEIADFNDEQIVSFVSKWFSDSPIKKDSFLKEFKDPNNQGLRELGERPLLLALLCLAFDANMTFPQRRSELYEDALDAMLRRWDSSRNIRREVLYQNLSLRHKSGMFSHIAAATFDTGEYFIQQRELENRIVAYVGNLSVIKDVEIDGHLILKSIESQHGIFVERARNIYSFSHLTIHEYYTAKYIADNEARGTTTKLIDNYLLDRRWREVVSLVAGLLDEPDDYLMYMYTNINDMKIKNLALIEILRLINDIIKDRSEYNDTKLEMKLVIAKGITAFWNSLKKDIPSEIKRDRLESLGSFINILSDSHFDIEESGVLLASGIYDLLLIYISVSLRLTEYAEKNKKSRVKDYRDILRKAQSLVKYSNGVNDPFVKMKTRITLSDTVTVEKFAREFISLFPHHCRIGEIVQDNTRRDTIDNYIYAVDLLRSCLMVAGFVTKRNEIEEKLLTMGSANEAEQPES